MLPTCQSRSRADGGLRSGQNVAPQAVGASQCREDLSGLLKGPSVDCLSSLTEAGVPGGGFRFGKDAVLKAARASLERLQLDQLPMYQAGAAAPCRPNLAGALACYGVSRPHQLGTPLCLARYLLLLLQRPLSLPPV